MSYNFTVHSAHFTTVKVAAKTADGTEVVGEMPCVIAELIPDDPDLATLTWKQKLPKAVDVAAAKALFVPQGKVSFDGFTVVTPKES